MDRTRSIPDACILSFSLIGGLLVLLTILALANLSVRELSDIPNLCRIATDSSVINSILLTMGAGFTSVLILIFFGTPLGYILARLKFKGKGIVEGIIDIPLMLPHTVAGILVYLLFMDRGILGAPLMSVGISFEDAFPGIVVAMIFVSSPYYINSVREGIEQVPIHIENVARTLGSTRFCAFRKVVLPLTYRHILNGSLLAWGRAIGEFAGVIMIAYYPMVISTLIYYRFTAMGFKEASAIAFVMILVCFVVFVIVRILTRYLGRYDDRV